MILMMVAGASYSRSHHRCKIQKLNSIYLKSSGTAAKAIETFNAYGLAMSHTWAYRGVESLARTSRISLLKDIKTFQFRASHDNLNMKHITYEQRVNNPNRFDSGTAATIYVIEDPKAIVPDSRAYHERWAVHCKTPISYKDILVLEKAAEPRLRNQHIFMILKVLLDSPAFDINNYEHKDNTLLSPLSPVSQLPTGPEYAICQYMLDTIHVEEASYDGNERCLAEWFRQLKILLDSNKQDVSLNRLIVWIGDQLTISRIRGLKKLHGFDDNAWERLEHIVEQFGWLHAQFAEEHSIHKQYYGTSSSFGLKHAFNLLKYKGLGDPSISGPFHQRLQDSLYTVADARFRDLWRQVGKVETISDLKTKSPTQLLDMAADIFDNYASSGALLKHRTRSEGNQDELLDQSIQFNRDILNYLDMDNAMRTGDVGRMENLLPRLLYRFVGGASSNYTTELLELLQGLHQEWTPELKYRHDSCFLPYVSM